MTPPPAIFSVKQREVYLTRASRVNCRAASEALRRKRRDVWQNQNSQAMRLARLQKTVASPFGLSTQHQDNSPQAPFSDLTHLTSRCECCKKARALTRKLACEQIFNFRRRCQTQGFFHQRARMFDLD